MLKKLLNQLSQRPQADYSQAINLTVAKYIECFEQWATKAEEDEEAADDLIYDQILAYVGDITLTNQLFVFVPVALTRIWFAQQPVKLSEFYSKVSGNSESQLIRLDSLEVYRQIVLVLRSLLASLSDEDAYKILIHSAEYKLIDHALEEGIPLENLRIAPLATGA